MSNFFRNIHPLLRRSKRPEKYDDTNFAVLNALNYELTQAEQETIASKIQSSLESATDTYLDTWGDWFGVYRKDGWDDEYYRSRIKRELLLKRGTVPAIIEALVDFLNDNDAIVQIYEPWRNIFYTNKSKLNGADYLMGYYYRFAIIDISIDRPFPPEIVEVIQAFKPAGVLFYLRLDTSLNQNKTTVESPYVYLDVTNKTELEYLNGLYYDLRGNINLTDQRSQVVENNIFHTNNSTLNGEDVLAGSFDHGRGYIHLASTALVDYTPSATDSMSDVKNTLGEAGADFYGQTKELDGRTARISVPSTKNIHTMYSNSTDFGNYDYSGNPNLLTPITANNFTSGTGTVSTNGNGELVCTATGNDRFSNYNLGTAYRQTALVEGQTYTISMDICIDEITSGSFLGLKFALAYLIGGNIMASTTNLAHERIGEWQTVKGTMKVTYANNKPEQWYVTIRDYGTSFGVGKFRVKNFKLEKGAVVTPNQPNLLLEPWQVSRVALNDNIRKPNVTFPINTTAYSVFYGRNTKDYEAGKSYTVTLKGRKPSTQNFNVFFKGGTIGAGAMVPVEGLPDVWTKTFTISQAHIDAGTTNELSIYQTPSSSAGNVNIEWLKIEEGVVATPPISKYDYMGVRIENTDTPTADPTKYSWRTNEPITGRKAYMAFDIKTFIEENYSIEFSKLVEELREDEAYNTLFENFTVSTALKALVSPSSPLSCSVELYDFSTNSWHILTDTTLDLHTKVLNLEANRITDYLNDYQLLFVRYSFTNLTSRDVAVELDMLNVLFNYRLGDGYSVGLQSRVKTLTDIPASSVTLSEDMLTLGIGESETLTATLLPTNATNTDLEWVILDPNIASATDSGTISGLTEGETKLIVYGDDRNVSAECDIKVVVRPTAITLDRDTININI